MWNWRAVLVAVIVKRAGKMQGCNFPTAQHSKQRLSSSVRGTLTMQHGVLWVAIKFPKLWPLFHTAAKKAEIKLSYAFKLRRESAELNSLVTLHIQSRAKRHTICWVTVDNVDFFSLKWLSQQKMRMRALGVHVFRSYREVGDEHRNTRINRAAGKLQGMSATVCVRPRLTLCLTSSALHGTRHFSFAPPGWSWKWKTCGWEEMQSQVASCCCIGLGDVLSHLASQHQWKISDLT